MTAPNLSFEFFPPKSEGQQRQFWRTYGTLETLNPGFVSVTWGALGAESQPSLDLVGALTGETSVPVVAHLACSGMTEADAHRALDQLGAMGVTRILALRGDAHGADAVGGPRRLKHATDLMELIARRGDFAMSVSAYPEVHPESSSVDDDIEWLARKAELGATDAITQFFLDTDGFLRWRDAVNRRGVDLTIVPGILPIGDIDKVCRFAASCGANVPDTIIRRFADLDNPADKTRLAIDVATEMCTRLQSEGIEQFHIYTLNRSKLTFALAHALGVTQDLNPVAAAIAA